MSENKKPGFIVAMKNFFGLKEGQTAISFGKEEVGKLSAEEKASFSRMLTEAGIEHEPPKI